MKHSTHQKLARRKRRILKRLRRRFAFAAGRAFAASHLAYELAERVEGLSAGGIGAIHLLAKHLGLPDILDQHIHVLKVHLPYQESDHVLNIAYNILAGGTCLEDLELRRQDEVYLNALGAETIPDPTTAGDFCRRFTTKEQIDQLMACFHQARRKVWQQQPPEFFQLAVLDADGTIAPTYGECKQGMDLAYNGQWGYHPLLISLANTKEVLYLVNRPGNRPSHEQADVYLDQAARLCLEGGFNHVLMRGDNDFQQSWMLDGWDATGRITFLFGADARPNLIDLAAALPERAWQRLERPARYEVQTQERAKPANVKEEIVRRKGFQNFLLLWEEVAEFAYRPTACRQSYRMIVLRKNIATEQGEARLYEDYRYFFYITNDRTRTPQEIVLLANDRCDQENLIAQLKNGVRALRNPLDNLHSNWAYMVMCSLAWNLKAWAGLLLPVTPGALAARHREEKRAVQTMEFKRFVNSLIQLPCQIVRTGRRIIYRLLAWNPWTTTLLRLARAVRTPLRC